MRSSYVLITAARDEEAHIEKTIVSVIGQTVLPEKWVIVSDGSKDGTDHIISKYATEYGFIQHERLSAIERRDFSSKVNAVTTGYRRISGLRFEFLGILDADVSFGPDYYERVLARFDQNPGLGIAGGVIFDYYNGTFNRRLASLNHANGPIQMFRRECFEEIGGFVSVSIGGEDAIASVMAQMNGWEVRTFRDIAAFHHRRTGTEGQSIYVAHFIQGRREYLLGFHPLFELAKCLGRVVEKPYVLSSVLRLAGYSFAAIRREARPCSDDFVKYLRQEQIRRLFSLSAIADFVWKPQGGS